MRRLIYLLTLLILPITVFCQNSVIGRVIDISTKKPIAGATVFLKNTTLGTASGDDGVFTLSNVPQGIYDVVVHVIGYDNLQQRISVNNQRTVVPTIELMANVSALREVKVRPDEKWFRLYTRFKKAFLGSTANAKSCKILNPEVIDLQINKYYQLNAKSDTFMVIENRALGYRIKYLLNKFVLASDRGNESMFYEGIPLFEEMKGTPDEKKQWDAARLECYKGSAMHFFRSVIKGDWEKQGFAVRTVKEVPNPSYDPVRRPNEPTVLQSINDTNIDREKFIGNTDQPGIYADTCRLIYVMYTHKRYNVPDAIDERFNMPKYASTLVRLSSNYAFFGNNGVILDPGSINYDGYWSSLRMGDLLPSDYTPPAGDVPAKPGGLSK